MRMSDIDEPTTHRVFIRIVQFVHGEINVCVREAEAPPRMAGVLPGDMTYSFANEGVHQGDGQLKHAVKRCLNYAVGV